MSGFSSKEETAEKGNNWCRESHQEKSGEMIHLTLNIEGKQRKITQKQQRKQKIVKMELSFWFILRSKPWFYLH